MEMRRNLINLSQSNLLLRLDLTQRAETGLKLEFAQPNKVLKHGSFNQGLSLGKLQCLFIWKLFF